MATSASNDAPTLTDSGIDVGAEVSAQPSQDGLREAILDAVNEGDA